DEIARPLLHDPAEVLVPALADRDQVHHHFGTADRTPHALGVAHVALDELRPPGREGCGRAFARPADEASNREVPVAQRSHDLRADQPGAAGDQDPARDSRALLW